MCGQTHLQLEEQLCLRLRVEADKTNKEKKEKKSFATWGEIRWKQEPNLSRLALSCDS